MQSNEQRRVIWRHPKGIYETVECPASAPSVSRTATVKPSTQRTATHAAWPTRKSSLHRRTAADRPEVRAYR